MTNPTRTTSNSSDVTSLMGPTSRLYNLVLMKKTWDEVTSRAERHPGDLFWKNAFGMMPIHIACCMRPPAEVIRTMLTGTKSVGILDRSSKENLPLHCACRKMASYDVIKMLLWVSVRGSADPSSNAGQRNSDSLSPLDMLLDAYMHISTANFEEEIENESDPYMFSHIMKEFWSKASLLLRALFLQDTGTLPDRLPPFSPLLIQQSFFAATQFNIPEKVKILTERIFRNHVEKYPSLCKIMDGQGRFLLNKAIENHVYWDTELINLIISAAPKVLEVRDKRTHLYPFMLAAVVSDNVSGKVGSSNNNISCEHNADYRQLETIYQILKANPNKAVDGVDEDKDKFIDAESQTKKRARDDDRIGNVSELSSTKKRNKKKGRFVPFG